MSFDLSHLGLDSKTLADAKGFKSTSEGRLLLYDGDGGCYEAAANAAKPTTALSRFEQDIYKNMFLAGCDKVRVHLTPSGCLKNGRGNLLTVKPYQENRTAKKKPQHLELLRSPACVEYFANHPDIEIILNYKVEADDALMTDHFYYQGSVLASPDKDLTISPFASYIMDEGRTISLPDGDRFGYIERKQWVTDSGNPASKVCGKGTKFFLAQMLMGDTADNVKGIISLNGKACGEASAFLALDPIKDASEAVNYVLSAYRQINQNPIPEAEAMWLLRNQFDNSYKFFKEHELLPINAEYLDECYFQRQWLKTEDKDNEV